MSDGWAYMMEKMRRWRKKDKNNSKSAVETELSTLNGDEDELDETPVRLSREMRTSPVRARTNVQSIYLVIMILGFLIASAFGDASCAQGININVANTVCSVNGDTETCAISFDSIFSIPGVGQAACYSFVRPDSSVVGTVKVSYTQMVLVAPLQQLYYTAAWNGVAGSWKSCFNTLHCGLWNCNNYNKNNDPWVCTTNIDGNTHDYDYWPASYGFQCFWADDIWRMYPGDSRCDSQCGCAGCGCFWCDSSCIYSRYVIAPSSNPCSVSAPVAVYLRPQITVNFTDAYGVSTITNIDVISNANEIGNNMTVTIDGTLAGNVVQFANQKVVACANDVSLGAASEVNAPVAHSVGDIQGNTPSSFSPWQSFLRATGLYTAVPASSSTTYIFEAAGFGARATHDFLPTTRGSIMWAYSSNNLVGLDTAPGALLGHLSTSNPVVVRRQVNVVCPVITSANASGCFSCDQGATITIFAHSSCSSGGAVVTATGGITIATTSVVLQTTTTRIDIKINSGTASIFGILTLTSGQYSDQVQYEATLVAEDLVVINNDTVVNTGGNSTGSGFLDFQSWFDGLSSFFRGLLVVGMIIGAIILVIVGLVVGSKILNAYRAWSIQNKYEKLSQEQQEQALKKAAEKNLDYRDMDFKE